MCLRKSVSLVWQKALYTTLYYLNEPQLLLLWQKRQLKAQIKTLLYTSDYMIRLFLASTCAPGRI